MEKTIPQFRNPLAHIPTVSRAVISGVAAEGFAYVALNWLRERKQVNLILAPTDEDAARVSADISALTKILNSEERPLLYYPPWDASPYLKLAPSVASRNSRISVLVQWQRGDAAGLIMGPEAFLQPSASQKLVKRAFSLRRGNLDVAQLEQSLLQFGYERVQQVDDPGTYSFRGGIIDIFSPFHAFPARLELFDVTVEKLRLFDPETQRSLKSEPIEEYIISPCREYLCDPESLHETRARIKIWADARDIPKKIRDRLGDALASGVAPQELDYLLPLTSERRHFVALDLSPETSVLILDPDRFFQNCADYFEQQKAKFEAIEEEDSLALPPGELFLDLSAGRDKLETLPSTSIDPLERVGSVETISFRVDPPPTFHTKERGHSAGQKSINVDHFTAELERLKNSGYQVIVSARTQAQFDRIGFLLSQRKVKWQRGFSTALDPILIESRLSSGFIAHEPRFAIITDAEIFGTKNQHSSAIAKSGGATAVNNVPDFTEGDLVVHPEHGIAIYKGILTLKSAEAQSDFALLEYADQAKLYVPVYRINILQRYLGVPGAKPAVDRLGTGQFEKTKQKARAHIKDIAGSLLKTQAERRINRGFKFSSPDELFREFEGEFPYEETPDQRKAIEDTIADMCSDQPMDRLVCGDVGFGKTEVALRAAFKAVQDGKQVAVLVPTTILAEQHFHTFRKRFSPFSVNVAVISRFHSAKEQKERVQKAKEGNIDVLIGTHRLLSKDVAFKDLGLLIVDEEQRFGVEHKERLKQMRAIVDVLTITATPIPRTLQLALFGLRDISVIRTPPAERMSVRTYIANFDIEIIKTAVERELARGGQVFFIHNRVESIESIHHLLQEAMPKVRIGVGHGQMSEHALEEVMSKFYCGEVDVLLATTIVENGLDVANANTLIVNRADTFGLSQLYQIRGRVGRAKVRAHAYFLVPENTVMTDDARQRLAVLQRFNTLGSGYTIATYDLELRGGGDILGQAQSGNITSLGYELYLELLEEEISRLKGAPARPKEEDLEISSAIPALLPEEYIEGVRTRLQIYRRLSSLETEEEIDEAQKELDDRFGKPPAEVINLLDLLKIKIWGRRLGIKAIKIGANAISLSARPDTTFDPNRVLLLLTLQPQKYTLTPQGSLTVRGKFTQMHQVLLSLRQLSIDVAGIQN